MSPVDSGQRTNIVAFDAGRARLRSRTLVEGEERGVVLLYTGVRYQRSTEEATPVTDRVGTSQPGEYRAEA